MPVKCKCKCCGKEFQVPPSQIKRGGGIFCSTSCGTRYRNILNNPAKNEDVRRKISLNHADVSGANNPMYGRRGALSPSYVDNSKAVSINDY